MHKTNFFMSFSIQTIAVRLGWFFLHCVSNTFVFRVVFKWVNGLIMIFLFCVSVNIPKPAQMSYLSTLWNSCMLWNLNVAKSLDVYVQPWHYKLYITAERITVLVICKLITKVCVYWCFCTPQKKHWCLINFFATFEYQNLIKYLSP